MKFDKKERGGGRQRDHWFDRPKPKRNNKQTSARQTDTPLSIKIYLSLYFAPKQSKFLLSLRNA